MATTTTATTTTPSSLIPVFLITGASSGFGQAIAHEALARGHHVIATARRASKLGDLQAAGATVLDLDVTADEATLDAVFAAAGGVYGRITHVVNCAGYLLEGTVEEASGKEAFDMFNTNVLGTCNVARAGTRYLREAAQVPGQRAGLATFGSLGSWRSGAGIAHYCSSKWAVSGLTEGLADELRPFGVDVCCFEPGYTRTGFLSNNDDANNKTTNNGNGGGDHRIKTARRLPAYHGTGAEAMRGALDAYNGKQPGDVGKSARVIVDVLTGAGVGAGREVPVRLLLGADCLDVVRAKCEGTLRLVEEWEAVTVSTMRDDGDEE